MIFRQLVPSSRTLAGPAAAGSVPRQNKVFFGGPQQNGWKKSVVEDSEDWIPIWMKCSKTQPFWDLKVLSRF